MWLRLRQVALVANSLAPVIEDLREVLGIDICFRDPGVGRYGLENALLPIGNTMLEVVAPIAEDTAGGRYLSRRGGDGGYMVITQCDDHAARRRRVEALGIRVVTHFETADFRNMQLHPRDTGGSFFEIDEQLGADAHDPDGPWEPAGGAAWKQAQRLDVVSGVTAVEMQCDDPANVAARWAGIAELPVGRDSAGHIAITLENATLRFVPIADGRPEGLGAMDVVARDRGHILAAAKRRGCFRDESQVYLCGMRVNLV